LSGWFSNSRQTHAEGGFSGTGIAAGTRSSKAAQIAVAMRKIGCPRANAGSAIAAQGARTLLIRANGFRHHSQVVAM